jgi:hypothetical protein
VNPFKRALAIAVVLGAIGGVTSQAIVWRDTDDQVWTDIAGPNSLKTWQFKDIMADRRSAEQLERMADAAERTAAAQERIANAQAQHLTTMRMILSRTLRTPRR